MTKTHLHGQQLASMLMMMDLLLMLQVTSINTQSLQEEQAQVQLRRSKSPPTRLLNQARLMLHSLTAMQLMPMTILEPSTYTLLEDMI
jgi:hypothetical protein